MDINRALQNLLKGTASEEEIEFLKRLLAAGEITIGGNVSRSIIIVGSGNTVEIPPEALGLLDPQPQNLQGDEIAFGLKRLEEELQTRAPVLLPRFHEQKKYLLPTLDSNARSLSESRRMERTAALTALHAMCMAAVELSFMGLCLGDTPPLYDARCPFRGLESFRPEDSEFFFGREDLTQKLVGRIRAHPFLAILGASGSGKSSLVMAGLLPALGMDYIIFRPGANPLEALASAAGGSLVVVDQFEELFTQTRDETIRREFITRLLNLMGTARVVLTLRSDFLGEVAAYRALNDEVQHHLENVPPMNAEELHRAIVGQARQVGLKFEANLDRQMMEEVKGEPGAMPLLQHALWDLWNHRVGVSLFLSEDQGFHGVKEAITRTAERVYNSCSVLEQEIMRDLFLRLTRLDDGDERRDTRRRVNLQDLLPASRNASLVVKLLDELASARLIVKTVFDSQTRVEVAHEALIRHWERLRKWLDDDRDDLRSREAVIEAAEQWVREGRNDDLLIHKSGRLEDAISLSQNPRFGLAAVEQEYLKACLTFQQREQQRRQQMQRRFTFVLGAGLVAALVLAALAGFQWLRAEKQTDVAVARQAELKNLAIVEHANKLLLEHNPDLAVALDMAATQGEAPPDKAYASLLDAAYRTLSRDVLTVCKESAWATAVDVSTDDTTYAVGCSDETASRIVTIDVSTGKTLQELYYPARLYDLDLSPDGQSILAGYSDDKAILWSAASGEIVRTLEGHENAVSAVAFNVDGSRSVTASYDKTTILWDMETGNILRHINGSTSRKFPGKFTSADISPTSGRVALGDDDGNVIVWDYVEKLLYYPSEKHSNFVLSVSFSPDGSKIVSSSADSTLSIWTLGESLEQEGVLDVSPAYPGVWIKSAEFVGDETRLLSALSNGLILLWDARSMQVIQTLDGHLSEIEHLSVDSNGHFAVSSARDGTVRLWDLQAFENKVVISESGDEVDGLLFTPEGTNLVGGSAGGYVEVWDAQTGSVVDDWRAYAASISVSEIALSPNGTSLLTVGSDGQVMYWDVPSHDVIWKQSRDGDTARSGDISPQGDRILAGYVSGEIDLMDTATGSIICTLRGHTNVVNSVRFSPDGQSALSGSNDYTVRLWDLSTCKEEDILYRHDGWVMDVRFHPNGHMIASASADTKVILWDIETQQQVHKFELPVLSVNKGLDGYATSLGFSRDGYLLAAGYANGNVALWSVTNGVLLRKFISSPDSTCRYGTHCFWILSTQFSPQGDTLWASQSDGTILSWDLISAGTPAELRDWMIANRFVRGLTEQEVSAYAVGE